MFEKIDEGLLLSIFKIGSPSYKETAIASFVKEVLSINGIDFAIDIKGNIYNISNENMPLLSAHMDTVQKEEDRLLAEFCRIRTYPDGKKILKGLGIIGGDDKCGVYIILEMLKSHKNLNFIFSVEEEVGGRGISSFVNERDFSKIPYGIVLDRRYGTDIICEKNNYGTKEFENDLATIGKKYNYSPASGTFSDANSISSFMSCANLSVGYYQPHSTHEYVSLEDLEKAIKYTEEIIMAISKRYETPKTKVTSTPSHGTYWDGYDYDEDYYRRYQNRGTTSNPITQSVKEKRKLKKIEPVIDSSG